ncbi:MAG: GNAT family N-acetyltransferase [Gammaproteobacteria bacterium]|nr:GNAT family N-acetyltransferase [Gammaproteobacteria bacterium]
MKKYMIKTKRLGLRLLEKNDIKYLEKLESDPEVKKYFINGPSTREQAKARMSDFISYYEDKGLPCFVMFELESNEFIGRCGFVPAKTGEIIVGYLLHKKFWGNGYASEALIALLEWSKQNIDADYIIAFALADNTASQRVMQKCGMEHYKDDTTKGVACSFYRANNQ